MDISSYYQLVPYHQGPRHVSAYGRPRLTGDSLTDRHFTAKRYAMLPPPHPAGHKIQSRNQESIYISSRLIKAHKINQVGLLIDIYA